MRVVFRRRNLFNAARVFDHITPGKQSDSGYVSTTHRCVERMRGHRIPRPRNVNVMSFPNHYIFFSIPILISVKMLLPVLLHLRISIKFQSQCESKSDSNKIFIAKKGVRLLNLLLFYEFVLEFASKRSRRKRDSPLVHSERKMEKVISLLAPRAGSDDLCRDLQRNARRPRDHLVARASEHVYTIDSHL